MGKAGLKLKMPLTLAFHFQDNRGYNIINNFLTGKLRPREIASSQSHTMGVKEQGVRLTGMIKKRRTYHSIHGGKNMKLPRIMLKLKGKIFL